MAAGHQSGSFGRLSLYNSSQLENEAQQLRYPELEILDVERAVNDELAERGMGVGISMTSKTSGRGGRVQGATAKGGAHAVHPWHLRSCDPRSQPPQS